MAFLTADIIAKQALATLHESLVVKPLIHTDLTKEFSKAKVGDTINIRKPAVFESKKFNRAKGIEVQAANEESIPVKLDQFDDVSFQVTSEELALDIEDFDAQLLTPAMQAISGGIDVALLGLADKVKATVGTEAGFEHNKPESLIQAGAILDANKVPQEDRYALVGPATKAHWLNTPILKQADQSGSTEALRRASLGSNVFGFDTYMTSNIKAPAAPQATRPPRLAWRSTSPRLLSLPPRWKSRPARLVTWKPTMVFPFVLSCSTTFLRRPPPYLSIPCMAFRFLTRSVRF